MFLDFYLKKKLDFNVHHIYVMVRCRPSLHLSVCPIDREQQRRVAALSQLGRRRQISITFVAIAGA